MGLGRGREAWRAALAAVALGLGVLAGPGTGLAGDLPAGKARMPALAACSDEDDGRIRLPGTDSCFAIGGEVELDVIGAGPVPRIAPLWTTNLIPRIALEHTTETDQGELRAFMRIAFSQSGTQAVAPAPDYLFVSLGDPTENLFQAGLTDSPFGAYNSAANVLTLRGPGVSSTMLRWARLPETGLGWSVAIENNPANIRQALLDPAFQTILAPGADSPPRVPNLTGQVVYAQDWGKVIAAGTVGQLRLTAPNATLPRFALLLGLEYNLTGALEGDTIWLQAVGASANSTYLGFGSAVLNGRLAVAVVDAVIARSGGAKPTLGGALTAAWTHVLGDEWSVSAFGSYADVRPARAAGLRPYVRPFRELRLGGNVVYTPVDKLSITAEVQWVSLSTSSTLIPNFNPDAPARRDSTWLGTVQVVRKF